jgi:hypothetical protein
MVLQEFIFMDDRRGHVTTANRFATAFTPISRRTRGLADALLTREKWLPL